MSDRPLGHVGLDRLGCVVPSSMGLARSPDMTQSGPQARSRWSGILMSMRLSGTLSSMAAWLEFAEVSL
jgi:hypothetical protein